MKNKIVGIWDVNQADTRLGSFIIYLAELSLLREINNESKLEVIIQMRNQNLSLPYLTTLIQFLPEVDSICFSKDFQKYNKDDLLFSWPENNQYEYTAYNGSTLAIQKFWKVTRKLIPLITPRNLEKRATEWLNKYVGNLKSIVVHLKNNKNDTQSNANQNEWSRFFNYCLENNIPVKFLLIGNEEYSSILNNFSNVIITKYYGGSLELDLALINRSFCFLGMSSGPCNMAILSNRPYLIWKHPGHHEEEMKKELQGEQRFIFSNESQKFMQDWDTSENLVREFNILYSQLNS